MQTTQSQDGTTLAYDVYGTGPALIYMVSAKALLPRLVAFLK